MYSYQRKMYYFISSQFNSANGVPPFSSPGFFRYGLINDELIRYTTYAPLSLALLEILALYTAFILINSNKRPTPFFRKKY